MKKIKITGNAMNAELNEKYAEVLLKTGLNIYKGQCLNISCPVSAYSFGLIVSGKAYEMGAKYVRIDVVSNEYTKIRAEKCEDDFLDFVPSYSFALYNEMVAENWAFLSLDDTEEQDVLSSTDSTKISTITKAFRQSRKVLRENLMKDKMPWCVAAYPGENWAEKVTGSRDVNKLWEILIPILKLDSDDPAAEWEKSAAAIHKRAEVLNNWQLDRIHFEGPGTDLSIKLSPFSRWLGAGSNTPDGRSFMPNIPTEEIFTTPDFRLTEGKVKVTMPLKVLEKMVKGAWFEFKSGKVINFGADENADILKEYLAMDDGASFLGEVALVDSSSPIYRSGKLFGSILYDENASCHIALGGGYPPAFSNSNLFVTENVQKEFGCNDSIVHTDFMIGSPEIQVTGFNKSGASFKIINNGKFVI